VIDKKVKTGLFKKQIRAKHLLIVWLFCVLGFGIALTTATNFFTSTVQETAFGNSDYFTVLFLSFMLLGFLSFGLAVLVAFFNIIRSEKTKRLIKSPVFIALAVVFAFVIGVFGVKVVTSFTE